MKNQVYLTSRKALFLFHLDRLIFHVESSMVGKASVTERDGGVREYEYA
jgi:hypothetical protein